jgi:hypothetical protein
VKSQLQDNNPGDPLSLIHLIKIHCRCLLWCLLTWILSLWCFFRNTGCTTRGRFDPVWWASQSCSWEGSIFPRSKAARSLGLPMAPSTSPPQISVSYAATISCEEEDGRSESYGWKWWGRFCNISVWVLAWWIAMTEATNCSFRNQEGNWEYCSCLYTYIVR